MDPTAADRSARSYCLFTSGPRALGLDVTSVIEVIRAGLLVQLPLCPRSVLGLCAYRGGFVPVVGPEHGWESLSVHGEDRGQGVLVLRTRRGPVGLLIDRGGVSVEAGTAGPDDAGPPLPGGFAVGGLIERDGRSHAILDPERTWQGLRDEIERRYSDVLGPRRPEAIGAAPVGLSGVAGAREWPRGNAE